MVIIIFYLIIGNVIMNHFMNQDIAIHLFREIEKWQSENQSFLEWRKANLRLSQLFKKEPETHE